MSPTGKNMAEIVRIRPGAFCWYQGAASVDNVTAQPKPSNGPAMKEFQNNLSHLICVFLHPILETNSMVCWGVKASMASATWKLERMMGWHSLIELEVEKKVKD